MKILVFTEGTIIMHKDKNAIHDYATYIPIGNAAGKLNNWRQQGAEIMYLTPRTKMEEVYDIKGVLKKYDFPDGQVFFRQNGEKYKDIAEKVMPDILIEDDCESIGGADNMTITHIKPEIKNNIKSIIVKEFQGIDYLADDICDSQKYENV
ncbi:MAG: hypothetical protein V1860_00545 [bacterium]